MGDTSGSDSLEGIVWDLDWFPQDQYPPSCSYKCRPRKDKALGPCSPKSTLKRLRIPSEENSPATNATNIKQRIKKLKTSKGKSKTNPCMLWVTNLSKNVDVNDVADMFEEFGDVEMVNLLRDPEGKFIGGAEILFKNEAAAKEAYEAIKVRYIIGGEIDLDASLIPPK